MRELKFSYTMRLDFDAPVHHHAFQLRCEPLLRPSQTVRQLETRLNRGVSYERGTDGFGNRVIYGLAEAPHLLFEARTEGTVLLTDVPPVGDRTAAAMYRQQTAFTQPGSAIRALYAALPQEADAGRRAMAAMDSVRSRIAYIPCATDVGTTAEQAAAQGCGVCQDQTQILLSLLRLAGIPCRYVSGLVPGEGRTHAWAEALIGDQWLALDATNGLTGHDRHIAFAVGRDHMDCALNRGVLLGSAQQVQTVQASVREVPQ